MTQLEAPGARRRAGLVALGVAGAALMFASGAFVANAMGDDDNDSPPSSNGGNEELLIAPAPPNSTGVGSTAGGRNTADAERASAGFDTRMACQAPVGSGVLAGGVIDPSKAGFEMNLPASGFTLESIQLRAEGVDCDDQGRAASGQLVLDTRWRHDETGLSAWVYQRLEPEPQANQLGQSFASFWANGYAYNAGVDAFYYIEGNVARDDAPPPPDAGSTSAAGAGSASSPVRPGQPDPRAQAVLEELVRQLAPGIRQECFAHETPGSWADLGGIGIGDPRGAMPSGYSEQYLNFSIWQAAAADCNTPAVENTRNSFDSGFSNNDGGSINISASGIPAAEAARSPGYAGDGNVSWNNGAYWFNVSGWDGNKPMSNETLRAIARALDSGFDQRCTVENSAVTADDLAALGVRAPATPKNGSLESTSITRTTSKGDCSGITGGADGFHASWLFSIDGRGMLEVMASKGMDGGMGNVATPYGYYWTTNGISYSVNAYKVDVDKDDLVEVAKSIDPSFDPSSLSESDGPGGMPQPLPKPVR